MSLINQNQVENIREFNRFYTGLLGLLNEGLYKSDFSLIEARIIYELGETDGLVARQLVQSLAVDAGYLSRVLNKLLKHGIVARKASEIDRRQYILTLTTLGEAARLDLRQRSIAQVTGLYGNMPTDQANELVGAMQKIQHILDVPKDRSKTYILRDPEVGDLAYIAHRQAVLYEQEYGFGDDYEAVVSAVVADYISDYNADKEKCWIAEYEGEVVGSIFCVDAGNDVAKLRLLYVDPIARGMGLGGKLIDEVIKFARKKAYKKIEFWTVDGLDAALHLYAKAGFAYVSSQAQTEFATHLNDGAGIMRQDWQMIL